MPGSSPYPLGLYDHPPDPAFSAISAKKLPDFPGVGTLRRATGALNDANHWLQELVPFP